MIHSPGGSRCSSDISGLTVCLEEVVLMNTIRPDGRILNLQILGIATAKTEDIHISSHLDDGIADKNVLEENLACSAIDD